MFRKQPQAFLALPQGTDELRAVIEGTLDHHQVRSIAPDVDDSMTLTVQDLLRNSDLVIADVTGANPNVMFEIGVAFGMGKRIVLLSRGRSRALPFDLATHQVAVYEDVDSVSRYLDLWLRDVLAEQPAD